MKVPSAEVIRKPVCSLVTVTGKSQMLVATWVTVSVKLTRSGWSACAGAATVVIAASGRTARIRALRVRIRLGPVRSTVRIACRRSVRAAAGVDMAELLRRTCREELAVVRRHLESGTGLLLVEGEAGIGKTKVVDTARAGSGVFVARGAGLPLSVEVPFLPLSTALHEVLRADHDWLDRALAACPAYVRGALQPLLPELTSGEGPAQSLDASSRPRLFKAVGTILAELADQRPLALLFDDLHWADGDTLDVVEHLQSTGARVPLLATSALTTPPFPRRSSPGRPACDD